MFGRKKVKDTDNDLAVVYVGLDDAHRTTAPTRDEYPSPPTYGTNPYSPGLGRDLPTIPNQDAILVHWYRPPADRNPAEWWHDNNESEFELDKQQIFQTTGWSSERGRQVAAENPWLQPAPLPRVTSSASPSNYRHLRPFDQRMERHLNGEHSSMASMKRAYPVNGMQPTRTLRNTFRLEPGPRDLENVDLSGTETPSIQPAVYVSPSAAPSSKWGL